MHWIGNAIRMMACRTVVTLGESRLLHFHGNMHTHLRLDGELLQPSVSPDVEVQLAGVVVPGAQVCL